MGSGNSTGTYLPGAMQSQQNEGCENEQKLLMFKRWRKLEKDFKKKDNTFDISKIPDICDNIKFDLLHNP